jgi:hypothetical protein
VSNQDHLLSQLKDMLHWKKNSAYYAEKLGVSKQEVDELRFLVKQDRKREEDPLVQGLSYHTLPKTEEPQPQLTEQDTNHISGNTTVTYQSSQPLSPKQLEQLAQVDNINTYVARTWLKSHKNGVWTYSIDIRYRVSDFYTAQELKQRIRELLPDYKPQQVVTPKKAQQEKALFVYLSDDHAGAIYENSIYGNEYSGCTYVQRLLNLCEEIRALNTCFEQVYIVSLGDQQNGYNQQTTRGGHEVKSESNKRQFDIYVTARRLFYDDLFTSGITSDFRIINLDNSNHSGLGMSYMANQAVHFWLEAKFPYVTSTSIDLAIDSVEYGVHVIGLTHGKDEKHQKIPFPLNLNDRTDVFFYQYFDKKGYSPMHRELHVIKGDLHQYNMNYGKSCRYVNVPSIMGSSNYSEINFGDTRPGALLEIYSKHTYHVSSTPIWFTR